MDKLWNKLLIFALALVVVGCGSKERKLEDEEHEEIKRDYIVRDASSKYRPGWIEDAELFARQKDFDVNKYRFFSYETTATVDRSIACDVAGAKVKAQIAGEVTTFIEKSLVQYKEGATEIDLNNPQAQSMKEFVETSLAEKTMAMIHGAQINKKYWEKRRYLEKLGAAKDFTAFTCAIFVKMDSDRLQKLIKKAAELVVDNTVDPDLKAKAQKALQDVDNNFVKARKGQI